MLKRLLPLIPLLLLCATGFAQKSGKIDPQIIELEPFVVYEGLIDVIDGFTGEKYHESNPVVDGFQETFNQILLGFHRKLLNEEYKHMKQQIDEGKAFSEDLAALAATFGINSFYINPQGFLTIEKAIFKRLMDDPFYRIEALIVWDLERLKRYKSGSPRSKYSRDIRLNPETGQWERRVMTEWDVGYRVYRSGGFSDYVEVHKRQGLNLDTNEGFHFIDRGLTGKVTPGAFNDVKLTYPIFVNPNEPTRPQVDRLNETYINNLRHIYDPFSWAMRRNVRFRGGFQKQLLREVKKEGYKLTERDWFDSVLTHLLNDIITIKYQGVDEIYSFAMLQKVPVNQNILGEGFDLLNWHEDEDRSVPYNPDKQWGAGVNFNRPDQARFILLDAYRRYPDKFIKEVLAEVSGMPADIYIKKVSKIQKAELERHKFQL
jgi:hypothetical protein